MLCFKIFILAIEIWDYLLVYYKILFLSDNVVAVDIINKTLLKGESELEVLLTQE